MVDQNPDIRSHEAYLLRTAELQFWLASAVRLAAATNRQPIDLPVQWSHGQHSVTLSDVTLAAKNTNLAAHVLQRSATYLLAVQIKNAMKAAIDDPKRNEDEDRRAAYQIARMTRNAFTHNPFEPVWSIDSDCRDAVFTVTNIITLDTTGLDKSAFDWRHYGGPLAFLKLSEWVRREVLGDRKTFRPSAQPSVEYRQQGFLILERLKQE